MNNWKHAQGTLCADKPVPVQERRWGPKALSVLGWGEEKNKLQSTGPLPLFVYLNKYLENIPPAKQNPSASLIWHHSSWSQEHYGNFLK